MKRSLYKKQEFAQAQNSRLGNANASVRASLALRIVSVASEKKRISTFIEIPKIQFFLRGEWNKAEGPKLYKTYSEGPDNAVSRSL